MFPRSLLRAPQPTTLRNITPIRGFAYMKEGNHVDLNHTIIKSDDPKRAPLVILHGLLGHLGNWRTISAQKSLSQDRSLVCADLRNHGASPRTEDMDYAAQAADVKALIERLGGSAVVLGHSMGGKVAMATALLYPELVQGLVVADIMPVEYRPSVSAMDSVHSILSAACAVDLAGATRQSVDQQLSASIPEVGVRQFLLTNLATVDGKLEWKPDVECLLRNYDAVRLFSMPPNAVYTGPTLLIRGAKSGYVPPAEMEDAMDKYFTNVDYASLDAGHWLHAEKPLDFAKAVRSFLDKNDI